MLKSKDKDISLFKSNAVDKFNKLKEELNKIIKNISNKDNQYLKDESKIIFKNIRILMIIDVVNKY